MRHVHNRTPLDTPPISSRTTGVIPIQMCRILIVDDEPDLLDLFTEVLGFAGHTVIGTAHDGNEAVFMFEERHPDIVLMDHRMPMMSGGDATEEIVHRHPEAKVIMITADETILPQVKDLGAVGSLTKPFDIRGLVQAIDDVVTANDDVDAGKELPED